MSNKLRIYLGDLTHDTVGLATEVMPLNVGYVAAYCLKEHCDAVEIRLFKYISELEDAITRDPPDVLGLSNYPWCHNAGLAMFDALAERRPEALRFMGGPNFPHDRQSQVDFLRRRPLIDAYVYLDGEVGFSGLVAKLREIGELGETRTWLRYHPVPGTVQLATSGDLLSKPDPIRLRELDEIPSPYLTGLLDPFFDGRLMPMISTNRGCPFRCTFCHDGTDHVNKVNSFSTERVKAELQYIGGRVPENIHGLFISDLNFGMYKRDFEICEMISDIQKGKGFPSFIDATTGKNSKRRIISAVEKLGGSLRLSMSVQSMSDEVLENVKRDNIRLEDMLALQTPMRKSRLTTVSEVIVGLPGETYESHIRTLAQLLDADIDSVVPYTLMMVNGSEMSTPEQRRKWGFKTKYRVIPRDFTALKSGCKVVEIEEVAIETNTMSFAEYIKARKVALLMRIINNPGYKPILRFIREQGLSIMALLTRILDGAEGEFGSDPLAAPPGFVKLMGDFGRDTEAELWDSEEEIVAFFQDDANFQGLVDGVHGKNLLQTFEARAFATIMPELTQCTFHHARALLEERDPDSAVWAQFEDIGRYCQGRTHNLLGGDRLDTVVRTRLGYDISAWLTDPEARPLSEFAFDRTVPVEFVITPGQYELLEDLLNQFGHTPAGQAKALIRMSIGAAWRTLVVAP